MDIFLDFLARLNENYMRYRERIKEMDGEGNKKQRQLREHHVILQTFYPRILSLFCSYIL